MFHDAGSLPTLPPFAADSNGFGVVARGQVAWLARGGHQVSCRHADRGAWVFRCMCFPPVGPSASADGGRLRRPMGFKALLRPLWFVRLWGAFSVPWVRGVFGAPVVVSIGAPSG